MEKGNPFPDIDAPMVQARHLYWMGWRIGKISDALSLERGTVSAWKAREKWDEADIPTRIGGALESRLLYLICKDPKEGKDYKEIDLLMRQVQRLARVERFQETGKPSDLNPNWSRPGQRVKKRIRNDFTAEQIEAIERSFADNLFGYQERWRRAGIDYRIRNILKSRQIGATYYFAREAFADAVRSGRNKIFLSASKAQASIFRTYIIKMAQECADVELVGDPIILANGAELHFLGTNAKTAQGYHGDVYLDEYFWIMRFQEFRKVTSGMAMHKKWRQTYISTPSAVSHEAYPFWNGDLFNKRRAIAERKPFNADHATLANGMLCPDGQWRQIVTIEDAIAQGCDLFDIEQLRVEYSPEEFDNLLMCGFLDDKISAFPMILVHPCMVDSWVAWDDVKPFAARPVGNAPVRIGYDPAGDSDTSDGAGLIVHLPPATSGGKHRILEHQRLHGDDYEAQARTILSFRDRYNVAEIGIDTTGIGDAVYRIVAKAFPRAKKYQYNAVLKDNMVRQAQHLMRKHRLEFDAGATDILQSFMAIRASLTAAGGASTYTAGRNRRTGHADLAWATMHALNFDPIEESDGATSTSSIMEIYQ